MADQNIIKWVEDNLVQHVLKNDDIEGAVLKKCEVQTMDGMKDNWASSMYLITLYLEHHGHRKTLPLLLKVMNEDKNVRDKMKSYQQFFNEIHFYSTVLSMFTSEVQMQQLDNVVKKLFPKCYYSFYNKNKKPETYEDAVIVMQNLKTLDYRLGDRLYLDFKHCSLALRCLGEFHALSYFMKERNPVAFMSEIVKPIYETNYDKNDRELWNTVFGVSEQRVIDGLASEVSDDDRKLVRLKEFATRNPFDKFRELVEPCEPLSVLCHGDFLRNNVMFRYEGDKPTEMKFIDFQTIRYASPVIDVSLLLCMNTTHELRVSHFEELLHVYYTSLKQTLTSLYDKSRTDIAKKYSFESFMTDFRHRAAYGYLISIEFLPWMFADSAELAEFEKVYWEERGSEKHQKLARKLGGDKATRALVDLAKDLIEKEFL